MTSFLHVITRPCLTCPTNASFVFVVVVVVVVDDVAAFVVGFDAVVVVAFASTVHSINLDIFPPKYRRDVVVIVVGCDVPVVDMYLVIVRLYVGDTGTVGTAPSALDLCRFSFF